MKNLRTATLIALTLIVFSLMPGVALAAEGDGSATSVPQLSTQAAAFTHEGFVVTSPQKGQIFALGETVDIRIAFQKFIPNIVNGCLDSEVDYIFFDICKDGEVKATSWTTYGVTPNRGYHVIGTEISRTWTPKETGVYTLRFGFSSADDNAGEVTDENYVGSYTFTVKKANPMTAKAKTVKLKKAALAKKAKAVAKSKAFTVKKAQGKVTFKAVSNVTKNAMKKVKVASNGKVTVKKGAKGTYKLNVQVTAAGNASYAAKTQTVKLVVKVK